MSVTDTRRSKAPSIPARLYEIARQRLLANAPLRFSIAESGASLSAAEAEVLASVGLSTQPWKGSVEDDPLQHSVADYMALLETSFTAGEVAKRLRVDVSRVRQRIRERSLFGLEYDGEYRLPRFQFERGHVLPGLKEVLAALPDSLSAVDVAQWILAPNPDLETDKAARPFSPRDWLLRGESPDAVAALARGLESNP